MDKESLFRWLSNALKDTPVDFSEVYVGVRPWSDGQVYVLFENLEEEEE